MNNEIKEILEKRQDRNNITMSKQWFQKLLDYITNLQEENEKLKQPQIFIDTMDMEERYGQELYEDYLKEQLEDYKSRIDKAIEYTKNTNFYALKSNIDKNDKNTYVISFDKIELLNILKGEDK